MVFKVANIIVIQSAREVLKISGKISKIMQLRED